MLIFVPVVILFINSLEYFSQRKFMFYFLAAAVSVIIIIQGVAVYIQNDVMRDEISFWSDNVEKSPRVHHSRQSLAVALLVAGRFPEALKEFEEAKESYLSANIAKRSITYGALGEYYYITRDDKKAFEYFDKSIKLYPSQSQIPLSYDRMATLLMWKGQLDKAEEMSRKAISLQPYFAEYYLTYSAILITKRQPEAAIKSANKALMLDNDLTCAYNYIADAFNLKKNKRAELHFRKLGSTKNSKCPSI
jgi:tetratricopeptide (TPR) repeat protein